MPENKNAKRTFINMSIGRAQAAALAEDFLDDIGSGSPGDLQPKETLTELFILAGEFVEDSQKNLQASNSVASGSLEESIEAHNPEANGQVIKVNIMMLYYGQFVNKGVRGLKSGRGLYQFKTPYPSLKMLAAIQKSIASGKAKVSNIKRTVSDHEAKSVKISDLDKAYGAARNIKNYGITPTGFLDKAMRKTRDKVKSRYGDAFKADIINSLNGSNQ